MTYLEAAEHVLTDAGEPLRYEDLTDRALRAGLIATQGLTPAATMRAQLYMAIKRGGDASPFVQTSPSTFGLRAWVREGRIAEPKPTEGDDIRITFFPEYDEVRALLPVIHGMTRRLVRGLRAAIWEQTGTTEANQDWTEPDEWIPARLSGEHREAASRIWASTKHVVNPRHMAGHWLLSSGYDLVVDRADGELEVSQRGREFTDQPTGPVVREIDEHEGLLRLLALVAKHGPASSGELLDPWMEYAKRVSRIRAESTGRSFLYHRLRNLTARDLLARTGIRYQATPAGLAYLQGSGYAEKRSAAPSQTRQLWELIAAQRDAVRAALRDRLENLDPYAFEHVVKRLLEEMGYTDVEVTTRSGDRGVDVIGRIVLGITEVREVVQVKRQRGNVHRPVLDMLRGSLHRFRAVRGTIITLGGFARGAQDAAFDAGVAPITLIDGEKLLDLLIDKGIGVRTETLKVLELDPDAFVREAAEANGLPEDEE